MKTGAFSSILGLPKRLQIALLLLFGLTSNVAMTDAALKNYDSIAGIFSSVSYIGMLIFGFSVCFAISGNYFKYFCVVKRSPNLLRRFDEGLIEIFIVFALLFTNLIMSELRTTNDFHYIFDLVFFSKSIFVAIWAGFFVLILRIITTRFSGKIFNFGFEIFLMAFLLLSNTAMGLLAAEKSASASQVLRSLFDYQVLGIAIFASIVFAFWVEQFRTIR